MTFIARIMAFARGRQIAGTLVAMITLVAVVVLAGLLSRCVAGDQAEQAVRVDRADAVAEATERVRAADAAFAVNEMARADQLANEQQELSREADKGDDRGVGPGTIAVLERLRQQQASR